MSWHRPQRKKNIGAGIIDGRSFINKIRSKGPKTVPCETPFLTGRNPEYSPFMDTQCNLLLRRYLNAETLFVAKNKILKHIKKKNSVKEAAE